MLDEIFDLVIVGSGVAGLTAALRAQQLGVKSVVLEKFDSAPGFGNGRISGGWFHAGMLDPKIRTPDELYDKLKRETGGYARDELIRAWADNVRRAYTFLRAEGATFGVLDPDQEAMQNVLLPQRDATIGRGWKDKGPDMLLSRMCRTYIEHGGDLRTSHRAVALSRDEGMYTVRAETPDAQVALRGRHVLLCDGGFQANPELVHKYITPHYKLRGSSFDSGEALRMGLMIGAKCVNMEWFYGYALCRDSLTDDRLWPYPAPGGLIYAGIIVNGRGERFVDEGLKGEIVANRMARCDTPENCWVIFDATMWEREGRLGDVPVNPVLSEVGGTIVTSHSIDDLARKAGLPVDAVTATVASVNAYWQDADTGENDGRSFYEIAGVPGAIIAKNKGATGNRRAAVIDPPRSAGGRALVVPPFYAIPLVTGITFTMGGLAVNRFGQVLDQSDTPIEGLYAAGGTMGGLQGGPEIGVAGGWSEAVTFGLLAAEHIAQQAASRAAAQKPD